MTIGPPAATTPEAPDPKLADFGYSPGTYTIHCAMCERQIDWCDKRSYSCRSCAENAKLRADALIVFEWITNACEARSEKIRSSRESRNVIYCCLW